MDKAHKPNVWGGNSGELFADLVREHLGAEGQIARVAVRPVSLEAAPSGAYLVDVEVKDGPALLFEVADWIEGARVMDPDGADLSRAEVLNYIRLRCRGKSARDALNAC
jgi:hypothetical protein